MMGSVTLVGAGPGDPGLLTVKGEQALRRAEVVVYDRLVSPEVLQRIPPEAEKIDVGKESGCHPVPQARINEILRKQAQAGKRVVRLKGGDPFLFGRGGEELAGLAEAGVPFEVVPGVTSALAVPAYAGIPVTHRALASSVQIITGHAKAGAALALDFDALRRAGGTLVFLMSVASLPQICGGLLDAGMDPATPAAVIEQGTLPQQRKLASDLKTLPAAAREAGVKSPATLIVGAVCGLSDQLDWFDRLPLKGREIIVTRPRDRSALLAARLRQLGASVTEYPCIRTVPRQENPELDAAIKALEGYRWLVFTSPVGPEIFFARLQKTGRDARALAGLRLAAIGPKTAQALARFGLRADLIPERYDSQHLAQAMRDVTGPVLLCRASRGSDALPDLLRARGIPFADVLCYDTVYETPDPAPVRALLERPVLVTFTSASTVRGFVRSLPGASFAQVLGCCIGAQTAAEARKYGIAVAISKEATIESLLECIKEV